MQEQSSLKPIEAYDIPYENIEEEDKKTNEEFEMQTLMQEEAKTERSKENNAFRMSTICTRTNFVEVKQSSEDDIV